MSKKNIITVGFAVFTMFFGAGNMVLPLYLMQKWPNDWLSAFTGFCITAVIVTLLGLIASVLCKGNVQKFFSPLGIVCGLALQIILISIEGPFGIIPRSMIVAYGAIETLLPISKPIFYSLTCLFVYFLATNKNKIIEIIGNILTPIKILFLVLIVVFIYVKFGCEQIEFKFQNKHAFFDGLSEGYLTYDLPGAIYFTSIAMFYFKQISSSDKELVLNGIKASLVSAFLLTLIYSLFIFIGLTHQELLQDTIPEKILPTIIQSSMGLEVTILFAIFIFLACSTTAVAAATIWTDFIHHYIPSIKPKVILALTMVIAFLLSLNDFTHLMKLLLPVLNWVYPVLILLTLYNISKNWKNSTND